MIKKLRNDLFRLLKQDFMKRQIGPVVQDIKLR